MKKRLIIFSMASIFYMNAAHAYLDPSTGGMLISAIIGMFATLGLVIKSYWYKLKSLFRKKEKRMD
ncbi:MAG: hypothetical protein L7T25_03095 [Gammaproteobacteria bacterium]|nr:hypothetical protein [Gammaproteobacteria bacterium]